MVFSLLTCDDAASAWCLSAVQVLWVAMDETSFNFMDAIAPGCATMYPSEDSVSL